MAWHCQRPNISHNDNQLFDKHFDTLFKQDYSPENILGLNFWARAIDKRWEADQLSLHDALLAYNWSRFQLLYAVQLFFSVASNKIDKVPLPSATTRVPDPNQLIDYAAGAYNSALDMGMTEFTERGRIFSPQNWLKSRDSLTKLKNAVQVHMNVIGTMPNGPQLRQALIIPADKFVDRWAAD